MKPLYQYPKATPTPLHNENNEATGFKELRVVQSNECELFADVLLRKLALIDVPITGPDCLSVMDDCFIALFEIYFGVVDWEDTLSNSLPCCSSFSSSFAFVGICNLSLKLTVMISIRGFGVSCTP